MGEFDETGVRDARKLSLMSAAASLAGAVAVSLAASPASAQTSSARPAPATAAPTQADLQAEIRKRDAVIADLLRRVEALERAAAAPGSTQAAAARPALAAAPATAVAAAQTPPMAGGAAPTQTAQAQAAPPPPAPAPGPAPVQTAQAAAPGQFEVDEEAADRALERTLVRTGALLLPVGAVEVEPSFQYSRLEVDAPVFVIQDGEQLVGLERVTRNLSEITLTGRIGLPWDTQLDLSLPYQFEDESRIVSVNFADLQELENDGDGFGDLGVALSKGLMKEKGNWPDLIAAVAWDTTTGAETGDFRFGTDFNELTLSLTAVKRADPLVWVGTLAWQNTFEEDDIEPGDQWRLVLGAVLAVSPTTSLRFNLDQAWIDDAKVNGIKVPGSDTNASSLVVGASSIISPRILLDFQAGVGLTNASPDYFVNVSLPIRFDSLF